MFVSNDTIYLQKGARYVKCVLHKKRVNDKDVYYIEETDSVVHRLPSVYSVCTLPEVIAKYGYTAVDDSKPVRQTNESANKE